MMRLQRAGSLLRCGALTAVAALASCMTSPRPQAVPQARSEYGEQIRLSLTNGRDFAGELLAVTDTSWFIRIGSRTIAFARIGAISVAHLSGSDLSYSNGARPSAKELEGARHAARFPYGIAPGVMNVLLAKASQSSPDDLAMIPR